MIRNILNRISQLDSHCSVRFKREPLSMASVATSVLPAVINSVGNLGASLFGQSSQKEENQKNRDFVLDMWNKQNEYNSPKNQMKLLREGGLNPYLFGDDAASSAAGTAPAPASAPLPTFQNPFNGSMQLLQQGLQVEANQELQHAEAMDKIYGVLFKAYQEGGQELYDQTLRELAPTLQRFKWAGSYRQQQLDNAIQSQVHDNNLKALDETFKQLENKWYGVLNNDQHRLNQDLHRQYVENLNKIKAEIQNINAMTDKTIAEKEKILVERVGVLLENGLKSIDYENAQELQEVVQETALENLWKLEDERHYKPFDKNYEYQGKTGQYFPLQSGQFGAAQNLEQNRRRDFIKSQRKQRHKNSR